MIESVDLENFKCFESLQLEMSNLNVLAGINSMGKSSLIQALLLFRQSYDMNAISRGIHLNGKYIQLGTGKDLMNRFSDEDFIGIKITVKNDVSYVRYTYKKDSDFLELAEGGFSEDFLQKTNLFQPTFSFVSASRIGPQRFYENSFYEVSENNQVGIDGELFAGYLAIRKDEKVANKRALHKNNSNELLVEQANSWLSEISPGIQLNAQIDNETGVVSLQYGLLNERYSPVNVGFGLSYVAPIVVSLLKAKEGDLVIIENPEAHLHPSGQRKMGELIAKAAAGGVQVIVETHSDHLLNGIRLSVKNKIIVRQNVRLNYFYRELEKDEAGEHYAYKKISPAVLDDGSLSSWPEGFFDEWDKALMDLM